MITVSIEGVIGWDIYAADVRKMLDDADGEDIDLIIHSPGGSVFEGVAIYNAIRDYRRAGGTIAARVVGLAASIATYMPMAADSVAVEDNAVWMIHNPWSFAIGDQRDLRKEADILEGISNLLAAAYERKTGKDKPALRAMMDDETWLFGDDIVREGFADSIVPAGDGAETSEEAVALAQLEFKNMTNRMRTEPEQHELKEVAALLNISIPETVVDGEKPAAQAEKNEGGVMDIRTLETEHSEVFAQVVQKGVDQERARVKALRDYSEADPENDRVAAIVNEAVAGGQTAADVHARLQVAIRDGGKLDGENPPDVATEPAGANEDHQFDALLKEVRGGSE
jgi:ATP-dependent protease ClpP protease subunit